MTEHILDINGITYRHGNLTLLDKVSFTLSRGESMVIFGPEGSGITNLFDIIVRVNADYDGDILYKGKSIKHLDYFGQMFHRREIGYVHGDYGLMSNMSVEQNISLPLEYHSEMSSEEIKKTVNRLIYNLNLDHCKKLRPYDLTRSEIFKVTFARSMALDPDLIYMEHAFEDQCPLNILTLTNLLIERSRMADKSLIIITYYPQKFIEISDSFIMFFNGKIVFQGNRDDFMTSENPYLRQYINNSSEGPMAII